ncbi:MAG: ATP phosphoribosyltransferase [Pseudomonadota bacterium]
MLTIALAKGRLLNEVGPLLAEAGCGLAEDPNSHRKLVVNTLDPSLRAFVVRASDVPVYVEHGAADLGIVGKDTLLENGGQGLYEPLDLGVGQCRLSVAGKPGVVWSRDRSLRVATKFERVAMQHFAGGPGTPQQVEIIKLYGSMELAPLVGLADVIVDLVDTGSTLTANGLVELETIMPISARLVVNKASAKLKHAAVNQFIERMQAALDKRT